jgi:hypothetical protein
MPAGHLNKYASSADAPAVKRALDLNSDYSRPAEIEQILIIASLFDAGRKMLWRERSPARSASTVNFEFTRRSMHLA